MASESIAHDSEPIRARGIIVNYSYAQNTSLTQALNPLRRCNLVIAQKEVPLTLHLTVLLVAAALRNNVLFEVFEKFIQSFDCGGEKNLAKMLRRRRERLF